MTGNLARIERFPIKSIGGEVLAEVELIAGQVLPGDRAYGVMHEDSLRHLDEDGRLGKWLPKSAFLRGAAGPSLQAVRGKRLADGSLRLSHPQREDIRFRPDFSDRARLVEWLAPLWPADKAPAAVVVEGPLALADIKDPYVSILSVTSLRALEAHMQADLGFDRWRANLWIDGFDPWAERGWADHIIQIGKVSLHVRRPIGRCSATSVDTTLGQLDCDMPAVLGALQDNKFFGVYAEVISGGLIRAGDKVEVCS